MKTITGAKLAKTLENHGWKLLRINGSHHIYGKPGQVERISIPIHGSQALKVGLLRHLLKVAGLNENDVV
jgi:predicted RNA binding protein YcfA (HicA-like mRNA interferase family)